LPCRPCEKVPATAHGLNDASTEPAAQHTWFGGDSRYNIAIRTGNGLLVLDVDGDEGEASLAALERKIGPLPETVISFTGRGRHHFFKVSDGKPVPNSASTLGPHLDIRGDGGYVLVEPSIHPNGRQYAWDVDHHPDDFPFAEAPGALLALLRAPAARPADPWGTADTIAEGGRNQHLASLAGTMRRKSADASVILAALRAENAKRCVPSLPDHEVRRIAESVARYGVAEPFAPTTSAGKLNGSDPDPPEIFNAALLKTMHLPPVEFIIEGLLPKRAVVLIDADQKVGKSLLAMQTVFCCAAGLPFLGHYPVERTQSLYIDYEHGINELQWRVHWLEQHFGKVLDKTRDDLMLLTKWPRFDERKDDGSTGWTMLLAELDRRPEIGIVVIDTWGRFMPATPNNSRETAYNIDVNRIAAFNRESQKREMCFILVHHTNKMVTDSVFSRASGSRGLTGSMDVHWHLARSAGEKLGTIHHQGRGIKDDKFAVMFELSSDARPIEVAVKTKEGEPILREDGTPKMVWQEPSPIWTYVGSVAEALEGDAIARVLAVLREGGKWTNAQLYDRLTGTPKPTIRNVLHRLRKRGTIMSNDSGSWLPGHETGKPADPRYSLATPAS